MACGIGVTVCRRDNCSSRRSGIGDGLLSRLVGLRRLNLLAYGDGEFYGRALTVDGHGQRVADGGLAYQIDQIAAAGDLRAVDAGDDVAA